MTNTDHITKCTYSKDIITTFNITQIFGHVAMLINDIGSRIENSKRYTPLLCKYVKAWTNLLVPR